MCNLLLFVLMVFFSLASRLQAEEYRKFVLELGVPKSAYATTFIKSPCDTDLKSDIAGVDCESFALTEATIKLILKQVEIYPLVSFDGYPDEMYQDSNVPDAGGLIGFEYNDGGSLIIAFKEFDLIQLVYTPSGALRPTITKNLLWVNSEFLSLIIYPFTSKALTRWSWSGGSLDGDDLGVLDEKIRALERDLNSARRRRDELLREQAERVGEEKPK